MTVEPQKSLKQIRAEFEAAQAEIVRPETAPLSKEGKEFIATALQNNPQAPGKAVREGKIQSGEFD
jgi:hypothetical protein